MGIGEHTRLCQEAHILLTAVGVVEVQYCAILVLLDNGFHDIESAMGISPCCTSSPTPEHSTTLQQNWQLSLDFCPREIKLKSQKVFEAYQTALKLNPDFKNVAKELEIFISTTPSHSPLLHQKV